MITKKQAVGAAHGEEVYSMRRHYKTPRPDGAVEPHRARVHGRCRTWRSHPESFRLPIKLNAYRVSEIDEHNAADWTFSKLEALRALNPLHQFQGEMDLAAPNKVEVKR